MQMVPIHDIPSCSLQLALGNGWVEGLNLELHVIHDTDRCMLQIKVSSGQSWRLLEWA